MADLNGDGAPDVALAIIGGRTPPGVVLLMNDGKGRFTETVRGLPPEMAWTPAWKFNVPFQSVGAVGAGDLDGDGMPEIATASYNSGDWVVDVDGKGASLLSERTIRVFRANPDGAYTEAWRSRIPNEIAGIPYLGDGSGGLGAASIQIADLDQDGRSDMLVLWENGGGRPNFVEFLKNQGNFQFADMTQRQFGTYQSRTANMIQLNDSNGDGIPDFQLREANLETAALATARTPLFLNDGAGHLLPLKPGDSGRSWTSGDMVAALGPPCPRLADCVWVRSMPMMFDLNSDGVRDLVLIDHGMQYSPPPGVQGTVDVYTLLAQPPPAAIPSAIAPTGGIRQRASINTAFFARLQATVRDSARRAVPNVAVTFRAPTAGASGVFAGTATVATAVTNAAGIATSPIFSANGLTGPYQILAEASGINVRASFSLTNLPSPPIISAVNVAGGGSDIAQNSWVEIRSTNLVPAGIPASGLDWSGAPEFTSGHLPESLPGLPVTVTVNGRPAYVYFVCRAAASSQCAMDQINVLTPLDDTLGVVPAVVRAGGVSSEPFLVNLRAAAPGFPLVGGTRYLVATHADYSLVGPSSLSTPGYHFAPASPGEIITIYGFGFGLPTAALTPGSSSQSGALPIPPAVEIGGVPVPVIFAGVVSPGLYQLNVRVPDTLQEGDHPLRCIYAGFSSAAGPLVAVGR
ncbi:MAG: VCBS repeat-containing protein [Acidobacteria bacterium]|nr:VCBS repeat-containing protein [Acidobacteriota bacterium]